MLGLIRKNYPPPNKTGGGFFLVVALLVATGFLVARGMSGTPDDWDITNKDTSKWDFLSEKKPVLENDESRGKILVCLLHAGEWTLIKEYYYHPANLEVAKEKARDAAERKLTQGFLFISNSSNCDAVTTAAIYRIDCVIRTYTSKYYNVIKGKGYEPGEPIPKIYCTEYSLPK